MYRMNNSSQNLFLWPGNMCGLLHRSKVRLRSIAEPFSLASQVEHIYRRLDWFTVVLPKRQNRKESDCLRKDCYKPCKEIYS